MKDYSPYFQKGRGIWLNTAHQGMLPNCAADAARQAIKWKQDPTELTSERFTGVSDRLRRAIAKLLNAPLDEIVLANSASYGLHLIANSYPWKEGDEIVVMKTDFPSDILPWLMLEDRFGVKVQQLTPRDRVLSPEELREAITPRTRLFCTTLVHSFSGYRIDMDALGEICRSANVTFVVNGSQAVGAQPVDVAKHPIDALTTVGFKWLCGPYGTGFCWISPRLLEQLTRTKAYWLSALTADDLAGDLGDLKVGPVERASDLDIFGTANFFNLTALAEAIELVLKVGADTIEAHNQVQVQAIVDHFRRSDFSFVSPADATRERTSLVLVTHDDAKQIAAAKLRLDAAGIHVAMRGGALRFSPHFYNSLPQVEFVTDALSGRSRSSFC